MLSYLTWDASQIGLGRVFQVPGKGVRLMSKVGIHTMLENLYVSGSA